MGIVGRYLVIETARIFLLAVTSMGFLMTLAGAAVEGIRHGLPLRVVVQAIPFVLPDMLQFIFPGCLLFAVCAVFGIMAANNELLALKSSGISPGKLVWPVVALSVAISTCALINQDLRARSRTGLHGLVFDSFVDVAYSVLRVKNTFKLNGVTIFASQLADGRLYDATIVVDTANQGEQIALCADRIELSLDSKIRALRMVCDNGQLELPDNISLSFGDSFVHHVSLDRFAPRTSPEQMRPADLPSNLISSQIARQKQRVAALNRELLEKTAHRDDAAQNHLIEEVRYHSQRLYRLQAERPRRLSNACACICFTLIGIPVAIWIKSANVMSVFGLCFPPILLTYYPLLIVGEMMARQGICPQLAPWLADAALLGLGVVLLRRLSNR